MNRIIGAGVLAMALSGCSFVRADYAPPTEAEAKAAFVREMKSYLLRPSSVEKPSATLLDAAVPEVAMAKGAYYAFDSYRDAQDRNTVRGKISSLQRVEVSNCEWETVRWAKVDDQAEARMAGIHFGHFCKCREFHRIASGDMVSRTGSGYFFRDEQGFQFAEFVKDRTAYERVRREPKAQ
ncbi:MAG: hypothetical protein QM676_09505 [Novosphingobium sp.]